MPLRPNENISHEQNRQREFQELTKNSSSREMTVKAPPYSTMFEFD